MWELLGKWVHYTHEIEKVGTPPYGKNYVISHDSTLKPGIGMVIGRRWLPNGRVSEEYYHEDGFAIGTSWQTFNQEGAPTPCYLVVKDDRSKPIWVDPSGVVLLHEFSRLVPVKYLDVVMMQAGK